MKFVYKIEPVLIIIVSVLCSILFYNIFRRLRNILPWKVNCWFCNSNHWVKLLERNSWTCVNCDQYNGFTKDGDYNKVLFTSDKTSKPYKSTSKRSPPKNGLCKMCNINQQLKIAQLANYIPMNEKNFDEEIDKYKAQLEKAYKLCHPCRKLVHTKLHREKEILLGSKLLEMRTPEKSKQSKRRQNKLIDKALNFLTVSLIGAIIILVSTETFNVLQENFNLSSSLSHSIEFLYTITQRIINIVEMKTDIIIEFSKLDDIKQLLYFDKIGSIISEYSNGISFSDNLITQQVLGGTICLVQILRHLLDMTRIKYILVLDLLLTTFLATSIAQQTRELPIIITSIIKQCCILGAWFVFRHKEKPIGSITRIQSPPKRIKNLNLSSSPLTNEDSSSNLDTDDDVSLRKFGIHNLTDSSNDTLSPKNRSYLSGRQFSPRSHDSIWGSPKSNSTYCVNSFLKSPSFVADNLFTKPKFNEYQKLQTDDSDSDLDDGLSSLSISSPKKRRHPKKGDPVFSLRQFTTATPSFVRPTLAPMHTSRPLISPSKLGHNASWVAGGYWGCEGERSKFTVDDSRSSSQSSGFESQTSSVHQRNVFSQPPSREESVCRESDRGSVFDRFQTNSVMSSSYQTAHNFTRISTPIYPQMQYDNHVHIPRVQGSTDSLFSYPKHNAQSDIFKAPVGSCLIKLPQINLYSN